MVEHFGKTTLPPGGGVMNFTPHAAGKVITAHFTEAQWIDSWDNTVCAVIVTVCLVWFVNSFDSVYVLVCVYLRRYKKCKYILCCINLYIHARV